MTAGADTVEECIVRADGEIRMSVGMKTKVLRGLVTITRRDDELLIVGRMARRDYLAAALAAETSAREPIEYLTAVSVVQRNYVDAHPERHAPLADLCDNTHCQLANLRDASPRVFDAVDRASAIHLRSDDAFPSYYSVNCGGATLTPAQVWKRAEPGYASVDCDHCRQSKWHRWQRTVAARPGVESVMRSAPATPFIDDDFKMRAGRTFGFNVVLSNTIDRIERHGQHYLVAGRGFGHRIGLCQDGARQLARSGRDAVDILRFYFPTGRVTVAVAP